jgi:hypothetical protein
VPIIAVGAGSLTTWGLLLGAVALLALWAQGRRQGAAGASRRTVPLGGGQALHVVELEGRRLVIGTGPGAAPRLLTELRSPVQCDPGRDAGREGRREGEGEIRGG